MTKLSKTASFFFIAASIAAASSLQALPAQAASNLQCNAPFNKKVLTNTTVRCQKKLSNFSSASAARNAARGWRSSASCNAHQSTPKTKVWQKSNGKWAARVKFLCARIT